MLSSISVIAADWARWMDGRWPLALIVLSIAVLWKAPQRASRRIKTVDEKLRFDVENEGRRTLAQILGGLFVLAGLALSLSTLDISSRTLDLSREGQITDRFSKAVEQLATADPSGRPTIEVRIGGIYALERIARENDYRKTILEILTTYVRIESPRLTSNSKSPRTPSSTPDAQWAGARPDVQAVLSVLARRDPGQGDEKLDMRDGNLGRATLTNALLSDADLERTDLSYSNMGKAHLRKANLSSAVLSNTELTRADLYKAHLVKANLINAA